MARDNIGVAVLHGNDVDLYKEGRRNRYQVHYELPLRHPIERHRKVEALIELLVGEG